MLYSRLIGRSIRRSLIWRIDGQRSGNEGGWRMLGSLDLAAALLVGAAGRGRVRGRRVPAAGRVGRAARRGRPARHRRPRPGRAARRPRLRRDHGAARAGRRAPPVVGMTTTLLLVETVILAVLCVLVAGL